MKQKSPKKEKGLKPSHREKKRYIVFQAVGGNFKQSDVKLAVEEALFEYLGVKGMSGVGLLWLKDFKDGKAIIRISSKSVNDVRSGLLFVKKIANKDARIETIIVSGMLKKAREKLN